MDSGACWAFLRVKLPFILFGIYPPAQQWRPIGVVIAIVALWTRRTLGLRIAGTLFALLLMRGGWAGLASVPTAAWGRAAHYPAADHLVARYWFSAGRPARLCVGTLFARIRPLSRKSLTLWRVGAARTTYGIAENGGERADSKSYVPSPTKRVSTGIGFDRRCSYCIFLLGARAALRWDGVKLLVEHMRRLDRTRTS